MERRLVVTLGSRTLDVFLVQTFGLVTFGSLGECAGKQRGVGLLGTELAWTRPRWLWVKHG